MTLITHTHPLPQFLLIFFVSFYSLSIRLCSDKRKYATSSRKVKPITFVGGCGLGIGSRIKGYMRYGGHWKPLKRRLYTSNGARRLRTINGAFICDNPNCVSVQAKKAVKGRGTLSAMEIGLSGLATLLFDATFPQFDPQASQSNTDKFQNECRFFLYCKRRLACCQ
ncbi:hypothetical protein BCV71DRAFT_271918 [Rhizopus microsporus]|uniref:Uncharacterized protein n=1 Tax=Rhizopus microsporus TaxID=58291 RepID=A0A1X0SCZ6_RHIZD|nr:hypothetical protein BCV71DRAFT_271918 [Rhizopus microsporus]